MCALDENTAVLFGGKGQGARFNDVYVLDMSTKDCAWHSPVCGGAIPTPRQDVAMCASDGVVYLHAGRDNFVRDDLYALDLSDRGNPTWEELVVSGRKPMPCYGHELAFVDGKLWTYGGFDELGGQCSKVYRLDFVPPTSTAAGLDKTDGAWTEMESELGLNESRIGVIASGRHAPLFTGGIRGHEKQDGRRRGEHARGDVLGRVQDGRRAGPRRARAAAGGPRPC
jgi:hypothetical protein